MEPGRPRRNGKTYSKENDHIDTFKVLYDRATGLERDDFLYLYNKNHHQLSPERPGYYVGSGFSVDR